MLKSIDRLFHFTKEIETIKEILKQGFKPSYAKETLGDKKILVPMVSFSNILLRDVGTDEVLFYGGYAICFNRGWGIQNQINPVVYTFDRGVLHNALNHILYSTIFLKVMQAYKPYFREFSENGYGPFTKQIRLTNTPTLVLDILDYLTVNYNENLIEIISNHAKSIYDSNFPVITLTKPYKVQNSEGKEFVAYNDREWRKLYPQLKVIFEMEDEYNDKEYKEWSDKTKPHFHKDEFILKFNIEDVKAILVQSDTEIDYMIRVLKSIYDSHVKDKLISENLLTIGTKDTLVLNGF